MKNRVWNGSQMMWDSFQTSVFNIKKKKKKNCLFYVSESLTTYTDLCLCTWAYGLRTQTVGFLWPLFFKNRFLLIKSYIFYFNTSQVNLTFDWILNQPWVLECGNHWGTRARVVRGTKCSVYTWALATSPSFFQDFSIQEIRAVLLSPLKVDFFFFDLADSLANIVRRGMNAWTKG